MIKCDGFGKLLKQLLFTLGISCFILLGNSFVNSEFVIRDNGGYLYSTVDTNLLVNVVNKGQMMTQRFGQTRRMLAISSTDNLKLFFFFSLGQKPYMMIENGAGIGTKQGFVPFYYICDGFSGDTFPGVNCSKHTVGDDFATIMGGFFQSITQYDKWGYDYWSWNCYRTPIGYFSIAFDSAQYGKAVVFTIGPNSQPAGCSCAESCTPLVNSLDIMYSDFTILPETALNTPPGFTPLNTGGQSLDGSVDIGNSDNTITGDYVYSTCTNAQAVKYYEDNGMNQLACFSSYRNNTDLYTGQNISSLPGFMPYGLDSVSVRMDTADLRTDGSTGEVMGYEDWFFYWISAYGSSKYDDNMFYGLPISLMSLFHNAYIYGEGRNKWSLVDYCDTKLYLSSTGAYEGSNPYVCSWKGNMSAIDVVSGVVNDQIISIEGTNWNGVGSGDYKVKNNPTVFIQDFFNLVKEKVVTNYGVGVGALPTYILTFLCALILFRFLMH